MHLFHSKLVYSRLLCLQSCCYLVEWNPSIWARSRVRLSFFSFSLHFYHSWVFYQRYKTPKIRTTLIVPGHIMTPMFSMMNLPSFSWYKFFFPSVAPVTVVKDIIAALDEQHSQTIYLPFYVNFAPYINLLPSFGRDFAQWVSCFSSVSICTPDIDNIAIKGYEGGLSDEGLY